MTKSKPTRRLLALALCLVLTLTLLPATARADSDVCEINGTGYTDLASALTAVQDGETKTIKLLDDIDYDTGILIENKTVTFDLNGKTLNVVCGDNDVTSEGDALEVDDGTVLLTGSGMFSVQSTVAGGAGVSAYNGGKATVTSVSSNGGYGVCASDGAEVTVNSNVTTNADSAQCKGVWASDATVTVGGNIIATATEGDCTGVYASNGATVTVGGSVSATVTAGSTAGECYGVQASSDAVVDITGGVTASGIDYCYGVKATGAGGGAFFAAFSGSGTEVTVGENVTATGIGDYGNYYGVYAESATVEVTGNATANAMGAYGYYYGVWASDATVTVGGVTATASGGEGNGVYAKDATVEISGDITATGGISNIGVRAYTSTVEISGDITATGGISNSGVSAYTSTVEVGGSIEATGGNINTGVSGFNTSTVTVGGDVTATGGGVFSYGVNVNIGSTVTVDGIITSTASGGYAYNIAFGGNEKNEDDYVGAPTAVDFYFTYTDGSPASYVYVRNPNAASISPASKTFTAATAGYGAQTAQVFTITNNTDTGTIASLTASLGGSSFEISTALSGTPVSAGNTATVSVRPKTGLSAGTYTDTLKITGDNGISVTASLSFTVTSASSGGGGTTPDTPSSTVIVDGKPVDAGEVKTDGDTTTVTVNQDTLNKQLESATDNMTINVPAGTGTASAQLVVQNIDDMAAKDMSLTVQVGNVQYEIPTTAIDTQAILDALGADNAADVQINITITTDMSPEAQVAVEAALAGGATLVFPPMEFKITATYDGQTVEIDEFSQYVTRAVEITAEQAARITTAIVVYPDGTTRQVPTNVYEKDGKWYAEVSSLTNSTYAFISNAKSFTDAKGKWYEAAVNEMGSRMIINGVGENLFAGDNDITRAEFAAIIVRALGLPENGSSEVFSDVSASAWYTGAVGKAYEYGIVNGVGDGKFDPARQITRQEAMAMVQRAAGIAGFAGSSGNLDAFTDAGQISDWASGAASWNVGSGLIQGSDGKLRPLDNITRAETAAVVLRLMQKAGLVDVRSTL